MRAAEEDEDDYVGVPGDEACDEEYDGEEEDGDVLHVGGGERESDDGEEGEDDGEEGEEDGEEEDGEEGEEEGEGEGEEEEEVAVVEPVAAASPSPNKTRPSKHKRQRKLVALLLSKYDSVWSTTEELGWTPHAADAEEEVGKKYHVCWSDTSVSLERIMKMGRMQKINHYPGMLELVRKAGTARNLNKMLKAVGKEYKFFPKTFMLPADYTALKAEWTDGKNHGNKVHALPASPHTSRISSDLLRSPQISLLP